jgi:hypothetical protein
MSEITKERLQKFLKEYNDEKVKDKDRKKRGHNDYNLISILKNIREEVGVHSKIIYSLLDVNGSHYQDSLFLDLFVEHVLEIKDFGVVSSVKREDLTENIENSQRRIDFTIESSNYLIGIEMKIDASDQENQISDYFDELKKRKSNNQEVKIYYLTLNGKDARTESSNNSEYTNVSFEKHIIAWLDASIKEVEYISNLKVLISQYKDIVNKLVNKDSNSLEHLINSKDNSDILKSITQQMYNFIANDSIENIFWEELKDELEKKTNKRKKTKKWTIDK